MCFLYKGLDSLGYWVLSQVSLRFKYTLIFRYLARLGEVRLNYNAVQCVLYNKVMLG